jgi:transcriptional regulator with XRE-family HTH domain
MSDGRSSNGPAAGPPVNGKALRRARWDADLTEAQLGAAVGITRGAINRLERSAGACTSPGRLERIAEVLGVPVAGLVYQPLRSDGEPAQRRTGEPRQ